MLRMVDNPIYFTPDALPTAEDWCFQVQTNPETPIKSAADRRSESSCSGGSHGSRRAAAAAAGREEEEEEEEGGQAVIGDGGITRRLSATALRAATEAPSFKVWPQRVTAFSDSFLLIFSSSVAGRKRIRVSASELIEGAALEAVSGSVVEVKGLRVPTGRESREVRFRVAVDGEVCPPGTSGDEVLVLEPLSVSLDRHGHYSVPRAAAGASSYSIPPSPAVPVERDCSGGGYTPMQPRSNSAGSHRSCPAAAASAWKKSRSVTSVANEGARSRPPPSRHEFIKTYCNLSGQEVLLKDDCGSIEEASKSEDVKDEEEEEEEEKRPMASGKASTPPSKAPWTSFVRSLGSKKSGRRGSFRHLTLPSKLPPFSGKKSSG